MDTAGVPLGDGSHRRHLRRIPRLQASEDVRPPGGSAGNELHADVDVDASASTGGGTSITSYKFDWGDGTSTTRTVAAFGAAAAQATHQYVHNMGVGYTGGAITPAYACGLGDKRITLTVTAGALTGTAKVYVMNMSRPSPLRDVGERQRRH